MTDWQCGRCRAQVAPGAPRCPECPSTEFIKPEAEADMLKIARDGSVSDSADVQPFFEDPGTGEPMTAVEHPADGTMSPLVGSDAPEGAPEPQQVTQMPPGDVAQPEPAAVPVAPPRRSPPPAAPGD